LWRRGPGLAIAACCVSWLTSPFTARRAGVCGRIYKGLVIVASAILSSIPAEELTLLPGQGLGLTSVE
jgi:hypothetical protein